MVDILLDTFMDCFKLLPFLFIAFFIIELLEHKFSGKSEKIISKSGKFGPILGGILGVFPQCGFSVVVTNLYVTRIVTLGTLIAVYLSTSDEMLPILLSEGANFKDVLLLVFTKLLIGIFFGFIIDFIIRKKDKNNEHNTFDICEEDNCHCEKGIIHSTLVHTLKTLLFIAIITLLLNIIMYYVGEDAISKIFMKDSIFAPIFASIVGLIPNCSASIILTELYLKGALSYAAVMAGLLTNSGIGMLILFKSNKNLKENILIISIIFGIGVCTGIVFELINLFIK